MHGIRFSWFQRLLLHLAFVASLFFLVTPQHGEIAWVPLLFYKALSLIIILIPVYFNFFFLYPFFLNRNKWLYAGMLAKVLLLFTLISYLRFQWINPVYVPEYINLNDPMSSLVFLFISLSGVTAVTMIIKVMDSMRKQKELMYMVKESQLEAELQFLKLQISPHFYFNIMNSIYHSIKTEPERAEKIVMELSEMMKYHIYDCTKEKVEINKEMDAIRNYIGLQEMRLASKPAVEINVKGNTSNKLIAPFILITFVESALKQMALEKKSDQPFLHIRLEMMEDEMQFNVTYTQTHFAENGESFNGGGILAVKKRLELLYPSRHQLHIDGHNTHYSVNLKIQLN